MVIKQLYYRGKNMTIINKSINPYGEPEAALMGSWPWGATWELYTGGTRPSGASTTSAICLLFCESGLVLTKTIKGGWEFTGGRCEMFKKDDFEHAYETIAREVSEESGAKLLWFKEVGAKVIYNPPGKVCINSESGLPFPSIGFQEYFIGWCDTPTDKPYGEEVLDSKVVGLADIGHELFSELHEPEELIILTNYFTANAFKSGNYLPEALKAFWASNEHYFIQLSEVYNCG